MSELTLREVSDSAKYLIELGNYYKVHTDATIAIDAEDGSVDPLTIKGGKLLKLISPDVRIPEVGEEMMILNPFKNIQLNTPALAKFYSIMTYVPSRMIFAMMEKTLLVAVGEEDESTASNSAIEYASTVAAKADGKLVAEFVKMFTVEGAFRSGKMLTMKYNKKTNSTVVTAPWLDEEYPSVRKGSIKILKELFFKIIGDDLSEYEIISESLTMKKLDSILQTLYMVYQRIQEPAKVLFGSDMELDKLEFIISKITDYSVFTNNIQDISGSMDVPDEVVDVITPEGEPLSLDKLSLSDVIGDEPVGRSITTPAPVITPTLPPVANPYGSVQYAQNMVPTAPQNQFSGYVAQPTYVQQPQPAQQQYVQQPIYVQPPVTGCSLSPTQNQINPHRMTQPMVSNGVTRF